MEVELRSGLFEMEAGAKASLLLSEVATTVRTARLNMAILEIIGTLQLESDLWLGTRER